MTQPCLPVLPLLSGLWMREAVHLPSRLNHVLQDFFGFKSVIMDDERFFLSTGSGSDGSEGYKDDNDLEEGGKVILFSL